MKDMIKCRLCQRDYLQYEKNQTTKPMCFNCKQKIKFKNGKFKIRK